MSKLEPNEDAPVKPISKENTKINEIAREEKQVITPTIMDNKKDSQHKKSSGHARKSEFEDQICTNDENRIR